MADDRTFIINTGERRGGAGWIVALVVVVALVIGAVFFSRISASQSARDNAIANAAHQVGNAAGRIGDAARKAGADAQDAANDSVNK